MRLYLLSIADLVFSCLTFLLHSQLQLSTQSWDASSFPSKKLQMLIPVHNNADDAEDADNYNKAIGIALLKAFSCANKGYKTVLCATHITSHNQSFQRGLSITSKVQRLQGI